MKYVATFVTLASLPLEACSDVAPRTSEITAAERQTVEGRTQLAATIRNYADPIGEGTDPRILEVMGKVERHLFVPSSQQPFAYRDEPLPIGEDQTISQPSLVALMTHLLRPKPSDVILEVGTGSGYQAAILSRLVRQVYTIEIVEPLALESAKRLAALGHANVKVRYGDGYSGWPEHAPFDGIIVTAGALHVPKPLLSQLRPGGRMVIPVGPTNGVQQLRLIRKGLNGKVKEEAVIPVRFVPLTRCP